MSSRLRNLSSTKISFFAFQDIITSVSGILILVALMLSTELDSLEGDPTNPVDPARVETLNQLLSRQQELDGQIGHLREMLATVETSPTISKIENDIAALEKKVVQANVTWSNQQAQVESALRSAAQRNSLLGLTELSMKVQAARRDSEALAESEAKQKQETRQLEEQVRAAQSRLLRARQREGNLWLVPDRNATSKEPILVTVSGAGGILERFDRPSERIQLSSSTGEAELTRRLREFKSNDQYLLFLIRPSGILLFETWVEVAREKGFEVGFDAISEHQSVHFSPPPVEEDTPTSPRNGSENGTREIRPATNNVVKAAASPQAVKPAPPSAKPVASAPKKKSWWQALLEWVGVQ